jgi:hypothetical protein
MLSAPDQPSLRDAISVSRLPPSFGQVALYDQVDKFLHEFCEFSSISWRVKSIILRLHLDLGAICPGRTVVKTDNAYKAEIAPMAEKSPLVQHAILSLSATYVMDFKQHRRLTERANYHHAEAIRLLTEELNNLTIYRPGKENAAVAALYLLAHNEVSVGLLVALCIVAYRLFSHRT